MEAHQLDISHPFELESGDVLPGITIAYHSLGKLNADKTNAVWVFHALTANSNPADWWEGLIGEGRLFDPEKHFIISANIIGSCYGSTGPLSMHPDKGRPWYSNFPAVTIRDMVKAHQLLQTHLGIQRIHLGIGGSMGGYQLLEWAYLDPELFGNLILPATSGSESAWGMAIHTSQRLAIEADPTWKDLDENAGRNGLIAARSIGMLTYRNYPTFVKTQTDESPRTKDHRASSYLEYQGEKLAKRFNAYTYWLLTNSMDSHHLGRGRSSLEEALAAIKIPSLVIGITSDILSPVAEQQFLAKHLGNATYREMDSPYGHDGFLIETEQITELVRTFLDD